MNRMIVWGIAAICASLAVAAWATVPSRQPVSAQPQPTALASKAQIAPINPLALMMERRDLPVTDLPEPF
jgi:hypothetical protein